MGVLTEYALGSFFKEGEYKLIMKLLGSIMKIVEVHHHKYIDSWLSHSTGKISSETSNTVY